jgi:hypothetical protein
MKYLPYILIAFLTAPVFGAEFLVMAKNNWMVDADKTGWTAEQLAEADRQYRIGDIVQVFPDGKLSDYATAGGKFYVIRVSGLSYDSALKYQQMNSSTTYVDGTTTTRMVSRRIYRIRATDLPTSVKNALKNTGVYNTTWTAVRAYIRNTVTGANE